MGRLLVVLLLAGSLAAADRKTKNVVLVTADGLRRQEIFTGIDPTLMREKAAGMDKAPGEALRRKLWAETPEQRRERLLPFFWRRLAPRGVVLGNVEKGSAVTVTNSFRKSYPGYSEILTCRAQDDRIRNNDPIQNPRPTVLEYVRRSWNLERAGVALFASWDVFRVIGENQPGTVFINAGYQPAARTPRAGRAAGSLALIPGWALGLHLVLPTLDRPEAYPARCLRWFEFVFAKDYASER